MADEDIANELEALSAIYEGDFENRPPLWNQPCFAINVKPNLESGGEIYCKCTLKFTLSKNYPKVIPKVDIESSEGLSGIDLKDLHNKIVEVTKLNIGEVMTHEVVSAVQDFLEARNLKPVTFYEAMLTREKRENDALQKLKSNSVGDHKTDKLALDSAAQLADEGVAPNSVEVESFGLNQDFIHLQSNKTNKKNKAKHSENDTKQPIDSAHKPPLVPSIAAPGAHVQTQSSAIELPSATMVADITKTITRKQPEHPTSGVKAWMQMFADQNEEEADGGSESDSDESVGGDHSAGHDSEDNAGAVIPSTETSRYKLEFAEISLLGSGASGEVWRAKNRLDQRTYAVKKINLNSRENSLNYHKIRREVTTISGLLHKYIVRYYAAWIEQQEMCESTAVKRGGSASSSISVEEDSLLVSPAYFHSSKYDVLREIDEDASRRQLSNQSSPVRPAKKSVSSRSGGASTNSNKLVNPSEAFSFTFESSDSLFDYGDEAKPSYRAGGAAGGVLGGGITPTNTMRRNEISFINSLDLSNGLDTSTAVLDSLNLSHDSDSDRSSESSDSASGSGSSSGSGSDESDSDASSSSDSYGSDEEENDGSDEEKKETHSDDDTLSVDQTVTRMSSGPKPPKTKKPKLCRFLFIQMEYCTSTLREKIDGGTLWKDHAHILKLLRQLLEALAYIHGRKVIHRDLKPANIFLDAEDNIKVGDFGLATNSSSENKGAGGRGLFTGEEVAGDLDEADGGLDGTGHSPVPLHRRRDKEQHDMSGDHSFRNNVSCMSDTLTGGIGTAMYSAPEQIFDASSAGNLKNKGNSSGNKPYNEKADLFSLGIILFEMCHKPFDTAMERFLTLTALRTKGQLPDDVSQIGTDTLRNIVVWLVQQDPHKRPSASELLSSPLISVRVDKDDLYLKEITAALWKPSSTAAAGIVSVLFDQKHNQFNAFGGTHSGAVSSGLNYSKLQLGAIDSSSTSLVPLKSSKDLIPESNENLFVQDQAMSYDLRVLQNLLKMLYPRAIQTPATQQSTKASHTNPSSSTQKKTVASAAQNKSQSLDLIAVSLQYALALKNVCKYVLLSHGAVEFAPALLQLRSSSVLEMLAASHSSHFEHKSSGEKAGGSGHNAIAMSTAAQFLDPSGQVVVLPSDLISPYARQAAYLNIRTSQRFQIDRVYNAASSLAETLREGVLTTGEHPRYSEEAVYDVILPGDDQSKVLADVEVLTATVEYLSEIKHFLPEYAIRITDPRIMDCIIQLCAWPTNRSTAPLTGTGSESGKTKKLIDQVDREKLLRVVSLATDRAAHGEALALLQDLKLPKVFETRFLPFFKIVTGQLETQRGESQGSAALKILELLEQEFERTDVIVGVQKQMAALDSPSIKRKTVAGTEQAEISAKAIESEANKKKASQSKFPKPNSSQAMVDLSKVGVKTAVTNKAQQGGKAATTLTAQPTDRLQLGPGSSVVASSGMDLFDKKERKHIRILLKSFAEAVSHLRAVITSLYALSHLQAQVLTESATAEPTSKPRTNSNLSSLPVPQFNAAKYNRNRANSVDSDSGANPVHGKKGITRSTSNSSENALDCTRGRAISAVLSCIVIDLGVDPRQKSRSGQSPFHHEGLHFAVEMFLSTSGGSHGGKVHKSTSEMTLASKSGDDISGAALSSSTAAANLSNILDAGGSSRRRHKGAGGIVAEGGQFDHLINAYRKYLYNVAGNKTVQNKASTGASITAVGVRFKLDVILAAVLKYEARQTKMQKNLHSAKANRNKTNTSTTDLNPSCSTGNVDLQHLLSAGQSVDVLVVSTPHHTNTAVELSELYCPDVESVAPVVQLLRQHSICATSYVHQLQGFVPSAAYALCCKLGIAYLVLVDASHSVKTTTAVSVQHCVPNGTETDAAVVKVPLSKLPSYLHTHAQSAFGLQRVLSRAHPLLGDMACTFGAETRPSDDRMAESTSEKSRAEVSASNEKVSAKTAKADHPSSAHSAASSKHSSGADTRTFSLILLESEPLTTETNKDRRVVAQRKKDSDNIRARVLAHMHSMWNCCSVPLQPTSQQHQAPAADYCNRIQVVSKVQGSKFTPGQIVCVEIPFTVLRTLNTIVMTRIGSSATAALTTMKHEFEALASSDLGKNHRKAMKQLFVELCSYTRYVNEVSASSASKNAGGNAPTATSAAIAATIQLYLYSIPDDRIDCINYSPQSLVNARIS